MITFHHLRRHRRLPLIVMMFLLVFMSACSAAKADQEAVTAISNTKAENQVSSASQEPATKTISTVHGDIVIPTQPKRIVAEEYLGSLIALDVIPVGAPGLTIQNYYFKKSLVGVADTGVYGKPSPEKIMSLQPDLIITANGDSYTQLSQIAPTVVIPYGDLKNAHEELTYFGKLFDKEDEAKAWLEGFDQRIAAAKAKVDTSIPANASFTIMEDGEKSTWVYGDNFGRGGQPVYQALGRKPPEGIGKEIMEKQWAEISSELLDKYAGDYIIMTSNHRTLEDFQKDPIWKNIPAVKNNKMYVWPEERSWYYDPLAVMAQTEELTAWLSGQQSK
ncbi:ABC transporter substrate-binding protein [Paenibacillus guangzhouensis]|uniref:ABC transporter substrate-binding protein n=1 Tax=Paenibacillus guangzhouensis TaxID=1473112 RepID=UPI001D1093F1|nr:ABC transporter substrate-binding protein [Paenibacillus guangzhouensis]